MSNHIHYKYGVLCGGCELRKDRTVGAVKVCLECSLLGTPSNYKPEPPKVDVETIGAKKLSMDAIRYEGGKMIAVDVGEGKDVSIQTRSIPNVSRECEAYRVELGEYCGKFTRMEYALGDDPEPDEWFALCDVCQGEWITGDILVPVRMRSKSREDATVKLFKGKGGHLSVVVDNEDG